LIVEAGDPGMESTAIAPLPIQHDEVPDIPRDDDAVLRGSVSEHFFVRNSGQSLNLGKCHSVNATLPELLRDGGAQHLIQQNCGTGTYRDN